MMKRPIWLILLLFIVAGRTLAQADCPTIVETAVQRAGDACAELGRNQACYGNVSLRADLQAGVELPFEQSGDIVSLGDVASIHLDPMDTETETWGVALLKTQANLPDTLPGQNVTMVVFGQVDMTNAAAPTEPNPDPRPIVFIVTTANTINVRNGPSTIDAVISSLQAESSVPADGRDADSAWLHIQLDDGSTGWVSAELVIVDGDISLLPVIDETTSESPEEAAPAPSYTPMQAFYFTTGIGDAPCAQAPDSGILIQTPEGVGTIDLLINEVSITLGSTAYITACPCGDFVVSVIDGNGVVSALGTTVIVPAGTQVHIPLDENSVPEGPPVGPEPYDDSTLASLPLALLPDQVSVAAPLTEEEIAAATDGLQEGEWTMDYTSMNTCTPDDTIHSTHTLEVVDGEFTYPDDRPMGSSFPTSFFERDGVHIPDEFTDEIVFDDGTQSVTMNVLSGSRIEVVIVNTFTANDCIETLIYSYTASDTGG